MKWTYLLTENHVERLPYLSVQGTAVILIFLINGLQSMLLPPISQTLPGHDTNDYIGILHYFVWFLVDLCLPN